MKNAKFEQVDERTVRISGAVFNEAKQKTLKLEGVKKAGYRTVCIGGIYDPLTIKNFDIIIHNVVTIKLPKKLGLLHNPIAI